MILYGVKRADKGTCQHPFATCFMSEGRIYPNTTLCGKPAIVEHGSGMCAEHYEDFRQQMKQVAAFPPVELILQAGEMKVVFQGGYISICPDCHREAELFPTVSQTAYCWDDTGEDPNAAHDMCADCRDDYYAYWKEMWDDYYRSRV